jgi:chromosome segregation ATPase
MKTNDNQTNLQHQINYIDQQIKQVMDMMHVLQRQVQMYQESKNNITEQMEKLNQNKRKLK